jgi:pimeloyl-ACP methyl ester carboxylesterase
MAEINHRFVDTNGIRMHITEVGEGPLVILCHGFPESWYSWRHQLPALAAAGYHVVAPDQRGYGQTDAPEATDAYTQLHLVGDMVGLIDALGEETAVIVGHDWGAPVAWNAATWRPDVIRAVAALSVPVGPRAPQPPTTTFKALFGDNFFYILYFQTPGVAEHELQNDVRKSLRRFLFGGSGNARERGTSLMSTAPKTVFLLEQFEDCGYDLPAWLTEADLDYFTAEFERTGFRGQLNWYRNFDRNWALSAPFEGKLIEQPSLFISGDRDLIQGNPIWESELRKVAVNLSDVVLLPGIGHWTQQEAPEAVNEALIGFLGSLD